MVGWLVREQYPFGGGLGGKILFACDLASCFLPSLQRSGGLGTDD